MANECLHFVYYFTIDDIILYVQFSNAPITDQDTVDADIKMLMKIGVFKCQYKEWHVCPDNQKDWANFKA